MANRLSLIFIFCCFLFANFTHVLQITNFIQFWTLFFLAGISVQVISLLVSGKISIHGLLTIDWFLFVFFLFYLFSIVINPNSSSINYLTAYTFVFIILLLCGSVTLSNIDFNKIHLANLLGVLLVSGFVVIDFITFNYLSFDIQEVIPRERRFATATYLGGSFRRSYGFTSEPGTLAMYFNTLGLIAIYKMWAVFKFARSIKFIFTTVFLFAGISTFSAGGFTSLALSSLLFLILGAFQSKGYLKLNFGIQAVLVTIPVVFILCSLVIRSWSSVSQIFDPVFAKMTFQDADLGSGRLDRWQEAIPVIFDNLFFGLGPGYYSSVDQASVVNWYLFLIMEAGIFCLIFMLLYLVANYFKIYFSKIDARGVYLVAFGAGLIQLAAMSTFFYPWVWLVLILFRAETMSAYRVQRFNESIKGYV